MKIKMFLYIAFLSLTGCFYAKTKITAADKKYIPYKRSTLLVFVNNNAITDTICLDRERIRTSNLEFFIDRGLGRTSDTRRPYMESYETEVSLKRTTAKHAANRPHLKYDPMIFTFFKEQHDPLIRLYYFLDGRWSGTISFDAVRTDTLQMNGHAFADVITIRNDSLELFEIDKMYWSVKYGLIRIDEKNGERWTILK